MIFIKQIRILFIAPILICIVLIFFQAFYTWFLEVYEDVDTLGATIAQINTTNPFYTLHCQSDFDVIDFNSTSIYFGNNQYYIIGDNQLLCTMEYNPPQNVNSILTQKEIEYRESLLINSLTQDNSRIIQICISLAGIEFILIIAIINYYSKIIANIVSQPIDELTSSLRNIDQNNVDIYFSERLQGELSKEIPGEMLLLMRSVYDFIGIVKIANQAFIQGDDGQAIIGYAVANQFYLENGNKLGAAVIQNNMGVIHIRNKRFQEAIFCFKEAIICVEKEWERYKSKYYIVGITEEELIIDSEYQNLSQTLFNRCFNLCEALSEFLLTEIMELQELLFSFQTQRRSVTSLESMLFAQVENPTIRSKAISLFNPNHDEEQQEIQKLIKAQGNAKKNIQDLLQLNDIMFSLRSQFLGTHDFLNNVVIQNIDQVTEREIGFLISQLWRDTIKTYEYCQEMMQFHLDQTKQKALYITLKLAIGYLHYGKMIESQELIQKAKDQIKQIQSNNNNNELNYLSLLQQKLYFYQGLIDYRSGNKIEGAKSLINSLCVNGKFSSRDRMQALVILKAIFMQYNQPLLKLNEFLTQYQPIARDWIFILETSKVMMNDLAIIRACKTFHMMISNINSQNDRISYGMLNNDYFEFIPLISKVDNATYIDKIFQYLPKPEGLCNYSLITEICKKYQSHPNIIQRGDEKYLTRDGIAFMRYKKIIIFACWNAERVRQNNKNDIDELFLIQFSTIEPKESIEVYTENQWSIILNKYQQIQSDQNDSNYFLEQII